MHVAEVRVFNLALPLRLNWCPSWCEVYPYSNVKVRAGSSRSFFRGEHNESTLYSSTSKATNQLLCPNPTTKNSSPTKQYTVDDISLIQVLTRSWAIIVLPGGVYKMIRSRFVLEQKKPSTET